MFVGEFEDSTALITQPAETGCACVDYRSLHALAISTAMALHNQVHQAPFPKPVDHCSDYEQQPGDSWCGIGSGYRRDRAEKQGAPTEICRKLSPRCRKGRNLPRSVFSPVGEISAGGYGDKRLSPKESEVLRLFAEGFPVTEIAKKLNRSIKTISSQKKSAMMKLDVENDIALLNYLSSVTLSPADKD